MSTAGPEREGVTPVRRSSHFGVGDGNEMTWVSEVMKNRADVKSIVKLYTSSIDVVRSVRRKISDRQKFARMRKGTRSVVKESHGPTSAPHVMVGLNPGFSGASGMIFCANIAGEVILDLMCHRIISWHYSLSHIKTRRGNAARRAKSEARGP